MKIKQIKDSMTSVKINEAVVKQVETTYNTKLSIVVKMFLSCSSINREIEDGRILSVQEIINSKEYLGVDFVIQGMIPIIDLFENDFLVYDINQDKWRLYNTIDVLAFAESDNWIDLV